MKLASPRLFVAYVVQGAQYFLSKYLSTSSLHSCHVSRAAVAIGYPPHRYHTHDPHTRVYCSYSYKNTSAGCIVGKNSIEGRIDV